MLPFLYSFFHNETNDRSEKGLIDIPLDPAKWPDAWKKIDYKEYLLLPPAKLTFELGSLKALLSRRRTVREVVNNIDVGSLSYILECGLGLRSGETEKRNAPSGGARYPIEAYLLLFKAVGDLQPGIYHYAVRSHSLEVVRNKSFSAEEIASFSPYTWLHDATGIICLSAVFNRSVQKYGSRGYRYILLEAGHIGQNILLAGAEREVQVVSIGGVNENVVEAMIGLNGSMEKIVYSLYLQ